MTEKVHLATKKTEANDFAEEILLDRQPLLFRGAMGHYLIGPNYEEFWDGTEFRWVFMRHRLSEES